jgi:hypothetical protein
MSEYCLQAPALEYKIAGCLLLPAEKEFFKNVPQQLRGGTGNGGSI